MKNLANYASILFFSVLLVTTSCSNISLGLDIPNTSKGKNIVNLINTESIYSETGEIIGIAEILRHGETITISIDLDDEYALLESKTWMGNNLDDVPHNKGTIILGKFPYKTTYDTTTNPINLDIPIIWVDKTNVFVFCYLTVSEKNNPGTIFEANIGTIDYQSIKSKRKYFSFIIPPETFSVIYNGNGSEYGEPPIDQNWYQKGESLTISGFGSLGRTGYNFSSWNTSEDGSGTEYLPGSILEFPDANITLYAQWTTRLQSVGMIEVEGGTFTMGQNYQAFAMPPHLVQLSSFKISSTEITQELYLEIMGYNPSYCVGNLKKPVECVSWYDAVMFCNQLSIHDGLDPVYEISDISTSYGSINNAIVTMDITKNGYRLPTEAEWEFAASGGNLSNGYSYSGSNNLVEAGWTLYNDLDNSTHEVGTRVANELGVYDMTGNVFEWCSDWFSMYTEDFQINPLNSSSESGVKIIRGGNYSNGDSCALVSFRMFTAPSGGYVGVGFRVAQSSK